MNLRLYRFKLVWQFRSNNILYAYAFTKEGKRITEAIDYVDMEIHIRFPKDAKISIDAQDGYLYLKADKYDSSTVFSKNDHRGSFWIKERFESIDEQM